jgi:hypothetical protein
MGMNNIEGLATNESLKAVITGLNVSPKDEILSICGSGDQAFAMLEKAKRVVVVDRNPCQINYFKRRAEKLKYGFFNEFLDVGRIHGDWIDEECLDSRNEYFSQTRLKKIQAKIIRSDSTREVVGDIFRLSPKKSKFNKIYLSNALDYSSSGIDISLIEARLKTFGEVIVPNGLIYITKWDAIQEVAKRDIYPILQSANLKIEQELTRKARALQGREGYFGTVWFPVVLQKK